MIEMLCLLGTSIASITIVYFVSKQVSLSDVEYNGYFITEARYYEPYETYVRKTCSRTTTTGKVTRTTYYDCSYCDDISAKYVVVDSGGNKFSITKFEYDVFTKIWNLHTPAFVDLHRDIDYSGSCGKDGDMYKVNWDGSVAKNMTSTVAVSYKNILQTNKSAFNYKSISAEDAQKLKLYDYPSIDNYKQQTILGLDSTKLNTKQKTYISRRVDYLNGTIGKSRFARVYYLLYVDMPKTTAMLQESYWQGGNRNEVNVCMGVDKQGNINWVSAFSWTKNKRVVVDIREDVSTFKNIQNINAINGSVSNAIKSNYKWRDFNDFNYLTFEMSTSQLIWLYVINLLLTLIVFIITIKNNVTN
jgi:hypothetical protein